MTLVFLYNYDIYSYIIITIFIPTICICKGKSKMSRNFNLSRRFETFLVLFLYRAKRYLYKQFYLSSQHIHIVGV